MLWCSGVFKLRITSFNLRCPSTSEAQALEHPSTYFMTSIFLIAIGGALGSVLRYISYNIFYHAHFFRAHLFPWSTFFVNIFGSFLAGLFYYFMIKHINTLDPRLKNFMLFGVLGGFTTFSAFSLDFFRLFEAGRIEIAFIYAALSVVLAILALFGGFYLMRSIVAM